MPGRTREIAEGSEFLIEGRMTSGIGAPTARPISLDGSGAVIMSARLFPGGG